MKKILKALVSLLLAAMLLLPCLPVMAEDAPVVITVTGVHPYPQNGNDLLVIKYLEEKFNVDLQVNFYASDAWQTQFTLMLADDSLPDLLWNVDLTKLDADRYGQEGFLLDLSQHLDKMPDYAALLEADAALNAFSRDENGAIYGFYKTRGNLCSRQVAMAYINNEWLKNVNMEYPTTTEELYQVLKAFKEQDANGNGDPNDEIPLSFTMDQFSGTRGEFTLRNSFGIYGYQNNYQLQVTDGKVWLADTSENWKAYVTYMHRLYEEGLLDPDCFIQTNDEYVAKCRNNQVGYWASWNQLHGVLKNDDKRAYLDYTFVTGFESELAPEIIYPLWNPVTEKAADVVSASASEEVIAKICEIMNYLYTEEGMIDHWIGIDGVSCTVVEGAYGIQTADGTGYFEDSGLTYSQWGGRYVTIPNAFQLVQYSPGQTIVDNATIEELKVFLDEAAASDDFNDHVLLIDAFKDYYVRQVKTCPDYPQVTYTTAEQDERAVLLTDITNYIQTMKAQFIIGETDIETGWDTYLETLNSMGLQRLLEIEQQVYDRYAKNL
ncbi:MAG: extracellular solute-binding protein [Clostridiales bacterium]|nr:extracellular solute-binding protein [Clostridiales bacterium]